MSLEVVKSVRKGFKTPLGDEQAAFLLELARKLHAGLLRKDSGTNISLPDGTKVAGDIIFAPDGHIYDVLIDQEGAADPSWQDKGPGDPSRFYAVPPIDVPGPGETPENPLEARVVVLEGTLKGTIEVLRLLHQLFQEVDSRLLKLETARTVRTEKAGFGPFAHSHEVKL